MMDNFIVSDAVNKKTMSDAMAYADNYHNYLWDKVSPHIGERVIEIGPGFGQYTRRMLKEGKTVLGIDISLEHLTSLKSAVDSPNLTVLNIDINNPDNGLDVCKSFLPSTILCMNLLEHIENDANALKFLHSICGNNCNLVMILPALPCLYNLLDKEAGHYKRYGLKNLRELLGSSGWKVEKVRYINMPGILGWLAAGYMSKLGKGKDTALNAPSTNALIKLYNRLFITISRITDIFFGNITGLSLFVVAKKRV